MDVVINGSTKRLSLFLSRYLINERNSRFSYKITYDIDWNGLFNSIKGKGDSLLNDDLIKYALNDIECMYKIKSYEKR